jgi:hypothetical protein
METLITLCYPAEPPKPRKSSRAAPEGRGGEYWTYGAHLERERYDHVDEDLITLIMRCQAHFPHDRPKLDDLEDFVRQVNRDRYPDFLVAAETLAWIHKILHEPSEFPDLPVERVPVRDPSPSTDTTTEDSEDDEDEDGDGSGDGGGDGAKKGSSSDESTPETEIIGVGKDPIRVFQGGKFLFTLSPPLPRSLHHFALLPPIGSKSRPKIAL